jgi:predicted adenylyl cyclase CyaB
MAADLHRTNLEVKARCADLGAVRERARAIATAHLGVDRQTDTYFATQRGRLKLRESSLSGGELIPYLRPDQPDPKRSRFRVIAVDEPESLKALLTEILGVHRVVRKVREIFLHENVRIHLDEVEGLGSFVELEAAYDGSPESLPAQQRKLRFLMDRLGIAEADLVDISYEGLQAR